MGTGIKVLKYHIYGSRYQIVPFMGTGIKAYRKSESVVVDDHRTLRGYGD